MSHYFEPSPAVPSWLSTGTAQVSVIRPDLAAGVQVTSTAVAWTYGLWAQLVAPNDLAGHVLTMLQTDPGATGAFQFQVGTGAAGLEVVIHTGFFQIASFVGGEFIVPVPIPVVIPANARVALRLASAGGVALAIFFKGQFYPVPL